MPESLLSGIRGRKGANRTKAIGMRLARVCVAAGVSVAYPRARPVRYAQSATPTGIANRLQETQELPDRFVPAVRQQCARGPYYTRTLTWCKLALLAEMVTLLPTASWFAFADADVLLNHAALLQPPLHLQPDVSIWLRNKKSALWAAKEITFGKLDRLPAPRCTSKRLTWAALHSPAPHGKRLCTRTLIVLVGGYL